MDCMKCKAQTQMTLEDDVIIPDSRPDAARLMKPTAPNLMSAPRKRIPKARKRQSCPKPT